MNNRSIGKDILVVIAITIISVALAFILPANWVPGRILMLPFVLVVPGYALTTALFPRRRFGVSQSLIFSLALSFVSLILGGLLLDVTPWGLHTGTWAVLLGSITLSACAVALVRGRGQYISTSGWLRSGNIGLNFRQSLLLGLAVLIVCGAVAVSIIGAKRQPYPGFTQLWILPANGVNHQDAVRLGVSNMESTTMKYRLSVSVDGKVVKEWPAIDLNSHENWETTLLLPQPGHAGTMEVEAGLYRTDAPTTIYRHVVLWLGS